MDSYRLSDPEPGAPCRPAEHNFAMNGKCWRCNHYRDDLLLAAQELLKLHSRGVPNGASKVRKAKGQV